MSVIVIQFTFGNLFEEWILSVAFDSYDYNSRRNVEIVEIQSVSEKEDCWQLTTSQHKA